MDMQSIVDDWKANAEKHGDRNFAFLRSLKMEDDEAVDRAVRRLHEEAFSIIDCTRCANCCKEVSPQFDATDVDRIAEHLGLATDEFKSRYLRTGKERGLFLARLPCVFLNDKGLCSIYDVRPRNCVEYPHTQKSDFTGRTHLHAGNTEVCPAVFWIVERLREGGRPSDVIEREHDCDERTAMTECTESEHREESGESAPREAMDPRLPVFRLKITLEDIEPAIWRRIETHDCSLADLHDIIQCCMDWQDGQLHAFEIGEEQYTDMRGDMDSADSDEYRDSRTLRLSQLVEHGTREFTYEYDFDDSWRHAIAIEATLPAAEGVLYPRCVDGRRNGPPEDCGGSGGYEELLRTIADPDMDDDERTDWVGEDFDPEWFSAEEVNEGFRHLRRWIGQEPMPHGQPARFAMGDRVRARLGTVHAEYPDIPLGGWVGTVERIAWLIPTGYHVRWTEDTLAAAHPVYYKRCRRDDVKPGTCWLDEGQLEADSPEQPAAMEQPTRLVIRPLDADNQVDRIRMVFGLTSDDPLPAVDDQTQRQYVDCLKARLAIPFEIAYWANLSDYSHGRKRVRVVGLGFDSMTGAMCEVRFKDETEQIPLVNVDLEEDHPNCQLVEDYKSWVWSAPTDGEEDYEDEDWEDKEDEEEWYEEEEEEDEEEYDEEDDNLGLRLVGEDKEEIPPEPEPIRRESPLIGRNDPCPCGSGKKFKKCCLGKQRTDEWTA